MAHVKALAIKGAMTLAALWVILTLGFGVGFWNTVILTVVLGALSYVLGDLFILPKVNNITATMADLGLAFLVVWLLGTWITPQDYGTMAWAGLISAVVIAIGEYLFHFYVLKKDLGASKQWKTSSSQ